MTDAESDLCALAGDVECDLSGAAQRVRARPGPESDAARKSERIPIYCVGALYLIVAPIINGMPDRHLFLQLATASQYVGQVIDRELEEIGLPRYLLALLTHVRDHAPVTPSRLSAASGMPMTTLRDNIQRLVDRGLVRRVENSDDGRSYLLVLTAAGKRDDPGRRSRAATGVPRARAAAATAARGLPADAGRGDRSPRRRAQSSCSPCSASHAFATRFCARVSQASATRSRSSARSIFFRCGMRRRTAG